MEILPEQEPIFKALKNIGFKDKIAQITASLIHLFIISLIIAGSVLLLWEKLKPVSPDAPTTTSPQSPVFTGDATIVGSFNTYVNDYNPSFQYILDEKNSKWVGSEYHSSYSLTLRTSIGVGVNKVGILLQDQYCDLLPAVTMFVPGEEKPFIINWKVNCSTPAPIKDTGDLFKYEILE